MTIKHTTGPWYVSKVGDSLAVVDRNAYEVATVTRRAEGVGETVANAHLLRAASDMLEALRKAQAIMAVDRTLRAHAGREDTVGASVMALIAATIAKAEGR